MPPCSTPMLIIGVVLGVMFDRFWQKFESQARLSIVTGFTRDDHFDHRIQITIRNVGRTPLQGFEPVLSNPTWGSFRVFFSREKGELGPGEERVFICSLIAGRFGPSLLPWEAFSAPEAEKKRGSLRLVLSKERMVLYENKKVGTALIEMLNIVAATRSYDGITGEMTRRANAQPDNLLQWFQRLTSKVEEHPGTGRCPRQ